MNPLIYGEVKETKDYLQDISKILGKLQQVFIVPAPHDWHKGLEIGGSGLSTQDLGGGRRILLDFLKVELSMDTFTLTLNNMDPVAVYEMLAAWALKSGSKTPVEKPELESKGGKCDPHQASQLLAALSFTRDVFKDFSGMIGSGTLSPLLVYPHHMDVSLVWFPKDDDNQIGFGFSIGDSDVPEPYYYVTQYPQSSEFTKTRVVPPARWQQQGFSGAILPYNDIVLTTDPRQMVLDFLQPFCSP